MAKVNQQATQTKQPPPQGTVGTPTPGSREADIAAILEGATPVVVENQTEEGEATEQQEQADDTEQAAQASEDANAAEGSEETAGQQPDETQATEQEEQPEELKAFLKDDGQLDKKKLAEALRIVKKDDAGQRLTKEEQVALNEYVYFRHLVQEDPDLKAQLMQADARKRGAQAPRQETNAASMEQVLAAAKKLREEGKPEEATLLLMKHDPEKVELREKLAFYEAGEQQRQREQLNQRIAQEFEKVVDVYGAPDAATRAEMQRLISEEGLAGRPMETVYKVAMLNLDKPVVKKQTKAVPGKAPVIPTRGTGVAKGGGGVIRAQPKEKPKNLPEVEQLAEDRGRVEKFFKE